MKCIYCGFEDSKVIDSRISSDSIRRRRECLGCGKRFTTYEKVEVVPILVVKSNGLREPFDREKIKKGLIKACEKTTIGMDKIEEIVSDIEKDIQNSLLQEIQSKYIGELVMAKLKELNQVAYVRFASVYKQFTDITNFAKIISELK